jgi:hypothetical protein
LVFELLFEKGHELLLSVIGMVALVAAGIELAMLSDGHLSEHDLMK